MRYACRMDVPLSRSFAEVARYREVLFQLVVCDLRLRHKHTKLGALWSLLNPALHLAVMTLVFSHMVRLEMRDYRIFAFSGLLPWMFFQGAWLIGAYAFVDNQTLLRRVYLPRVVFPLGRVLVRLVDYLVSLVVLGVVAVLLGYEPTLAVLALPAAILVLLAFAFGVATAAAVVAVYVRDFLHLQTVLAQLIYLATPILYPLAALPAALQPVAALNPVYIVIRLFHRLIYDGVLPGLEEWLAAAAMAVAALSLGLWAVAKADNDLVLRL